MFAWMERASSESARQQRQDLLPLRRRGGIVAARESRAAGERQRLEVPRLELERARDQPLGLAFQAAAARHGERFGEIGEQLRVARRAHRRLGVRVGRLGKALERGIGAPEQFPAGDVIGVFAQVGGEALDQRLELHPRRIDRARIADRHIEPRCGKRHRQGDKQGERTARAAARRRLTDYILEQARFELGARALVVLRAELSPGEVRFQLAQLISIDGNVGVAPRNPRSLALEE